MVRSSMRAAARSVVLLAGAFLPLAGCIGIYDNTDNFSMPPNRGASEVEVLERYGTPAFASEVDGGRVFTYKVRSTKYIVLAGVYQGYDLVVTFENGRVKSTTKVPRADGFCLFSPLPWAVVD